MTRPDAPEGSRTAQTAIRIRHDRRGAVVVTGRHVQVTGEICPGNVALLRAGMDDAEAGRGTADCIVDLTGVTYIDCAGLAVIAAHAGSHPVLQVATGSTVERVVELFGLGGLVPDRSLPTAAQGCGT